LEGQYTRFVLPETHSFIIVIFVLVSIKSVVVNIMGRESANYVMSVGVLKIYK